MNLDSTFVQIGDAESTIVLCTVLDEVFGDSNHISTLSIQKTGSVTGDFIQSNTDTILWYSQDRKSEAHESLS